MVRTANGPLQGWGRFCCAEDRARGREIKAEAASHLTITDAAEVIANNAYRAILIDAFEQRRQQVGGEAVLLDAVVEIAAERGYPGCLWSARQLIERDGEFIVQAGPSGRLIVHRAADFP